MNTITIYIMAGMLAIIVAFGGYHAWTVSSIKAQAVEDIAAASSAARTAALKECAASRQVAVNMARAESMATQAALSGIASSQLAAAEQAKTQAERLADGFARQLVKQAQAKPLATPCNITAERAALLNRATGADR